jgi:hypothetical protein
MRLAFTAKPKTLVTVMPTVAGGVIPAGEPASH